MDIFSFKGNYLIKVGYSIGIIIIKSGTAIAMPLK